MTHTTLCDQIPFHFPNESSALIQHTDFQKQLRFHLKSILIIDDSPDSLELDRMILESEGFQVFSASGGQEALSMLNVINKPDLILVDLNMAEMSGLEFLLTLEEERNEIFKFSPVVFHTAADSVPPSKACGIIHRPIDICQFVAAVHRFIDNRPIKGPYRH